MHAVAKAIRPLLLALLVGALALGARPAAAIEIRTMFVPFGGPSELGRSVATILALQFWQTLRKQPPGQATPADFGDGSVYWVGRQVPIETHQAASTFAQAIDVTAQHVLWGQVHSFDNGALVTSYLTLPDYRDFRAVRNEAWTLTLRQGDRAATLNVDVPQRVYAFEPIVLPADFVTQYSSPGAIQMMSQKGGGQPLGPLGINFVRIQSDGDYAQVYSNRKTGWVYLPQIGRHKPELIDFAAGIMRVYRTDWQGAIELFGNVLKNESAPTNIRIDSLLYVIRAKSELGQAADDEVKQALALAPASRRVVQYAAMYYLARCYRPPVKPAACRPGDKDFLTGFAERYDALFAQDDPWLAQLKGLVRK
jgi:hypothetical protein